MFSDSGRGFKFMRKYYCNNCKKPIEGLPFSLSLDDYIYRIFLESIYTEKELNNNHIRRFWRRKIELCKDCEKWFKDTSRKLADLFIHEDNL